MHHSTTPSIANGRVDMGDSRSTPEALEQFLDRLITASQRIARDVEEQAKQLDHRIKALADQGERTTNQLVKAIDSEFRSQVTSLRREIEQLAGRVAEMSPAAPPIERTVAKRTAAKRPAQKPPRKAAPAKKPPVKKQATKQAASKRVPAKKSPAKRT
jgi:chromosome segregation ATPase